MDKQQDTTPDTSKDLDEAEDDNDNDDDDNDDEESSIESGPLHFVFSPEDIMYDEEEFVNPPSTVRLRKAKSLDDLDEKSKDDFLCCKSRSLDDLESVCMNNEIEKLHNELDTFQQTLDNKDRITSKLENNTSLLLQTISDLKIQCAKKDEEIKRLCTLEKSFKQTKQVLKDTTWTLKVKEEELNNIKVDMRRNYEKRLNEVLSQLNEKEVSLAEFRGENLSLSESEKNNLLRIQELSQQVKLLLEKQPTSPRKCSAPIYNENTSTPIQTKTRSHTWSNDLSFDTPLEEDQDEVHDRDELFKQNKEYELKIQLLESDLSKSRNHINELYQMHEGISTNSDMLPTTQVEHAIDAPVDSYLLHVTHAPNDTDSVDGLDDLNSLRDDVHSIASEGDISEGRTNLRNQMEHTVKKYEFQIKELQTQYDNDLLTLEKENKDLQNKLDAAKQSLSNLNSSALDTEELREQFEQKMSHLKQYYDEQEQKHLNVAKEEIKILCIENEELQSTLSTLDDQHKHEIRKQEEQLTESYRIKFKVDLEQALEQRQESLSSAQEELQEQLSKIQSSHDNMYDDMNLKFTQQRRLSAIEDTYSNELVLLHEDKAYLEHKVQGQQDELQTVQIEYDKLKQAFEQLKSQNDNSDRDTVNLRADEVNELQQHVHEMNLSILDIQTEMGSINDSNVFDKSADCTNDIGFNFHRDIKLLRENLDDAKSDVQNLVSERDKFSQLSSTLSDQLTSLKSDIENEEKKKRSIELKETENKDSEKLQADKALFCQTLQVILNEVNSEIEKKWIIAKDIKDNSETSLLSLRDNVGFDSDSIKIMSENIGEEVSELLSLNPQDLSKIFMNQCKYLIEKIELRNEKQLRNAHDLMTEEFNKYVSELTTGHEKDLAGLQDEMDNKLSEQKIEWSIKQNQSVLEKENEMRELLENAVEEKEKELQEQINEAVLISKTEMTSKLDETVCKKENEMLEKLHQAIAEKEMELKKQFDRTVEEKTKDFKERLEQKDFEHEQELLQAAKKKEQESTERLNLALAEKENELHNILVEKEAEMKESLQDVIKEVVTEKENSIQKEMKEKLQHAVTEKEKEVRGKMQTILDQKDLEIEEKLRQVVRDIEIEFAEQLKFAINNTQSEMQEKLQQAVKDKEEEAIEQLHLAIVQKESEMALKLNEAMEMKENEMLEQQKHSILEKEAEVLERTQQDKDAEVEALVAAHEEELYQLEDNYKVKLNESIEHEENEISSLKNMFKNKSIDMVNHMHAIRESYKKDKESIENTLKDYCESLEKSRIAIMEKITQKFELNSADMLGSLSDLLTSLVINNSCHVIREEELLEKLREIFQRAVNMQSEHLDFFNQQIQQKITDIFSRITGLESKTESMKLRSEFEDSIEQIADEYVVLALENTINDAVGDTSFTWSPSKKHRPRRQSSNEHVYKISIQSETFVEEEKVFNVSDQFIQTEVRTADATTETHCTVIETAHTQTELQTGDATTETHRNVSIPAHTQTEIRTAEVTTETRQNLVETVQTQTEIPVPSLKDYHYLQQQVAQYEEQQQNSLKNNINILLEVSTQTELDLRSLGELQVDVVTLQENVSAVNSQNVLLRGSVNDLEIQRNEEMKNDLLKQHELLLDEFAQEQEKEMQKLDQQHTSQMEEFNTELYNSINNMKRDVQQILQQDEEFLLATDITLANITDNSQLNNDWSSELSELKELLHIIKLKHAEDLTKLKEDRNKIIDQQSHELTRIEENAQLIMEQHAMDLAKCEEDTRVAMENEHLDNLAELEKSLEEKHVEQLQKLSEFQQLHLNEISRLQDEHNSNLDKVKEVYEKKLQDLKYEAEQNKPSEVAKEHKETLTEDTIAVYSTKLQHEKELVSSNEMLRSGLLNTIKSLQQSEQAVQKNIEKYIQRHENSNINMDGFTVDESFVGYEDNNIESIIENAAALSLRVNDVVSYLLNALEESNQELNDHTSLYNDLSEQYKECSDSLLLKEQKCEELQERIDLTNVKCTELENKYKAIVETVSKMQDEASVSYLEKEQLFSDLNKQTDNLEKINNEYNELNQQLSSLQQLHSDLDEAMAALESECNSVKQELADTVVENEKLTETKERIEEEVTKATTLYEEAEQYNTILGKEIENIKQSLEADDNEVKNRCVVLEEERGQLQQSLKVETGKNKQLFETLDVQNDELEETKKSNREAIEQCKMLADECEELRKGLEIETEKNGEMNPIFMKQVEELTKLRKVNTESKLLEDKLRNECQILQASLHEKDIEVYGKLVALGEECEQLKDSLKEQEERYTDMYRLCEERAHELAEVNKTLEATQEECNKIKQSHSDVLEENKLLEAHCKELENRFDEENLRNGELFKTLQGQDKELTELRSFHDESNERCISLENDCEELNQELDTFAQRNKELNELLASKTEELSNLSTKHTELNNRFSMLERECQDLKASLKTMGNESKKQNKALEQKFESISTSFTKQTEKNKDLYNALDSQAAELADTKSFYSAEHFKCVQLEEECSELKERLTKVVCELEDHELAKQQYEMLQSSLESLKEMHEADQELIKEQEKLTVQLEKDLENERKMVLKVEKELGADRITAAQIKQELYDEQSARQRYELKTSELEKEIDELRNEVSNLNHMIEDTNTQVNSARGRSERLAADGNSTMKLLISDIQQEADDVLDLVLNSPDFNMDGEWNAEKQALLENIKALKGLANRNKETVQKSIEANVRRELLEAEDENSNLRTSLNDLRLKLNDTEAKLNDLRLKLNDNEVNLNKEQLENQLLKEETKTLTELVAEVTNTLNVEKMSRSKEKQQLDQEITKRQSLTNALQRSENQLQTLRETLQKEKSQLSNLQSEDRDLVEKYESLLKNEAERQSVLKGKLKHEISQSKNLKDHLKVQKDELDQVNALLENMIDVQKYEKLKAAYVEEKQKHSRMQKAMRRSEDEMQSKISNLQNINTSLQNDVEDLLCFNASNSEEWEEKMTLPSYKQDRDVVDVQQPDLCEGQKKLLSAGWTLAKVQRLYLKYFRAESFRRALTYQKKYLQILLKRYESKPTPTTNNSKFKAVAIMIIAINRMKYFVRKYQRNLHKSSASYHFKDSRPDHRHKSQVQVIPHTRTIDSSVSNSVAETRLGSSKLLKYSDVEMPNLATVTTSSVDCDLERPSKKYSSTRKPGGESMLSPNFEDKTKGPSSFQPVGTGGFTEKYRPKYTNQASSSDESIDLTIERHYNKGSPKLHRRYSSNDDIIAKANIALGRTPPERSHDVSSYNRRDSDLTTEPYTSQCIPYDHRTRSTGLSIQDDNDTYATTLRERNMTHTDVPCSYPRPSNSSPSTLQPSHRAMDVTGSDKSFKQTSRSQLGEDRINHYPRDSNKENLMLNDYIRKLESLQHRLMKK